MKIENMGVKISEVPYLGEIVIADGRARIDDGDNTWYCEIEQLREMRDALDAAIRELEPAATVPVTLFTIGQNLTGDEDLPVGATVSDGRGDVWCQKSNRKYTLTDLASGRWTLGEIAEVYGPVTLASLP